MFERLEIYLTRSREERRKHLKLDEPCIEIGGDSRTYRGLLAHFLKTTLDYSKAYCCHACNNSKCSNVFHLYWGSGADNTQDAKDCGRWKSVYQRSIEKLSLEEISVWRKKCGNRFGRPLSQDTINDRLNDLKSDSKNRGKIARLSRKWQISHTQVKRFINKYGSLVKQEIT